MKKKIQYIIYDDLNIEKEAYEFDLKMEKEYDDPSEEVVITEYELQEYIEECLESDLSYIEDLCQMYNNSEMVIYGHLGLWDGSPKITPVRILGLWEAIQRCVSRNRDYNLILKQDGVNVYVSVIHHDGRNEFTISQLNSKGINAKDNVDISKKYYHKNIPNFYK